MGTSLTLKIYIGGEYLQGAALSFVFSTPLWLLTSVTTIPLTYNYVSAAASCNSCS